MLPCCKTNAKRRLSLTALDQAARQTKVDAGFLLGLSDLYQAFALQVPAQKEKARAGALDALNRAASLASTDPALELRLADSYGNMGASDKSAEVYLDLLKRLPDVPYIRERVHAQLADIYLRKSDRKHG